MILMISFLNRLLAVFTIAFLIDLYAYQAVKTVTERIRNNRVKRWLRMGYWVSSGAFILPAFITVIISIFYPIRESGFIFQYVFALFALFYVPKLIIVFFLLLEDIFRLFKKIFRIKPIVLKTEVPTIADRSGVQINRKQFISQIGLMVASVPFVGVLHGITIGRYNFQVFTKQLKFQDLPDAFSGLKIVHISDIHSGSFDNPEAVRRGIDLILEQKPDVIFFTGDLVNSIADEVTPWHKEFSRLKAPLGVFSILGNHDYGDYAVWESDQDKSANFDRLLQTHKDLGWQLLLNQAHLIEKDGAHIAIAGVENWGLPPFPQYGDLEMALKSVPERTFTILLSHDPTHWDEKVIEHNHHVHLTLSGHTHGMQFGVELGDIRWSPISFKYPRWAGLYEEAGKFLYVNRGLGTVGFPGRVGIFPEVTLITLLK